MSHFLSLRMAPCSIMHITPMIFYLENIYYKNTRGLAAHLLLHVEIL